MRRIFTKRRANVATKHDLRQSFVIGNLLDKSQIERTRATKNAGWDIRRIDTCRKCFRKFWGSKLRKGRDCPECYENATGIKSDPWFRYLTEKETEELSRYYQAYGVRISHISDYQS